MGDRPRTSDRGRISGIRLTPLAAAPYQGSVRADSVRKPPSQEEAKRMLHITFDESKVSPREAQLINALIAVYISLGLSIKKLKGEDPSSRKVMAEFGGAVAATLRGCFPDLTLTIVDEP